jgi:hypothetical protein
MPDPKARNCSKSGAKRAANALKLKATPAPAIAPPPAMRRSSRVRGEEGPAFPVSQKQASVADLDASEDDVLVYLGKRAR